MTTDDLMLSIFVDWDGKILFLSFVDSVTLLRNVGRKYCNHWKILE